MNAKQKEIHAYIDSQNLYLGVKEQGWELDYNRFLQYLRDKYGVSKAYLFIGYVPRNQKLYSFLEKCGYVLIFKPTLFVGRKIKGNVDAELVLHAVNNLNKYDKAIIVSGDGDFRCLLDLLERKEQLSKVFIPNRHKHSALLRKYRTKTVFLDSIRRQVEKR